MDQFEKKLEEATKKLKECQKQKQINSCFNCEKLFECEIRKQYVESVYQSMNKGSTGGFDF